MSYSTKTNDAWIVFKLNTVPIMTKRDGDFDCLALMEAHSGMILGTAFLAATTAAPNSNEPNSNEIDAMFVNARAQQAQWPSTLWIPESLQLDVLETTAQRYRLPVQRMGEMDLQSYVGPARAGFQNHFGAARVH